MDIYIYIMYIFAALNEQLEEKIGCFFAEYLFGCPPAHLSWERDPICSLTVGISADRGTTDYWILLF